jgi:hypothetical protein
LVDFGGAEHELGLLAQTEDRVLELHGISGEGVAAIVQQRGVVSV